MHDYQDLCDFQYPHHCHVNDFGSFFQCVFFGFYYYCRQLAVQNLGSSSDSVDACYVDYVAAGYSLKVSRTRPRTRILTDHPLDLQLYWAPKPAIHCSSYVFYHLEFSSTFYRQQHFGYKMFNDVKLQCARKPLRYL